MRCIPRHLSPTQQLSLTAVGQGKLGGLPRDDSLGSGGPPHLMIFWRLNILINRSKESVVSLTAIVSVGSASIVPTVERVAAANLRT